jgi:hypothetical protein
MGGSVLLDEWVDFYQGNWGGIKETKLELPMGKY